MKELFGDVLKRYGILGLLVTFLVWFITDITRGEMQATRAELTAHASATALAVEKATSAATDQRELSKELLQVLRQTCLNTAVTVDQRARCVQ